MPKQSLNSVLDKLCIMSFYVISDLCMYVFHCHFFFHYVISDSCIFPLGSICTLLFSVMSFLSMFITHYAQL